MRELSTGDVGWRMFSYLKSGIVRLDDRLEDAPWWRLCRGACTRLRG